MREAKMVLTLTLIAVVLTAAGVFLAHMSGAAPTTGLATLYGVGAFVAGLLAGMSASATTIIIYCN